MANLVRVSAACFLLCVLCIVGATTGYGQVPEGPGPEHIGPGALGPPPPGPELQGQPMPPDRIRQLEAERSRLERRVVELERRQSGPDRPWKKVGKAPHEFLKCLFVLVAIVNVLLAIWVYQDLQRRKTGSGIWVIVVLLAGVPGTVAYGIVRIPEMMKSAE